MCIRDRVEGEITSDDFAVGDQVTALSTAGFAAGVRYTMYRAQGLSSEAFDYHVAMTEEGETTLSVTAVSYTHLGQHSENVRLRWGHRGAGPAIV